MGEGLSWKKLIEPYLVELADSTVIGSVLVISLFSKNLVDDEEKDELLDHKTSNFNKATRLFCRCAKKWNENNFEDFIEILKETGNNRALQILTATGDSGFTVKVRLEKFNEMKLFKQQMKKEREGQYEGISLEDEKTANKIVDWARKSIKLENGQVQLAADLDKNEIISLLRRFNETLKNEHVWWNPSKPQMPTNFIPRRICETNKFSPDGTLLPPAETKSLLEVIEKLVLIVDSPGMGKSTEMTKLEQNLREHYHDNRVVVRVNLNEVQEALFSISRETAAAVLVKIASFLPLKTLQIPEIRIFVLLDGLDEVCPTHQKTMINLLRILKFSKEPRNLQVLLTARPHLKEAVEIEFNLDSFSLVPLSTEEQNSFVESELNYSSEHLRDLRKGLSPSLLELLGNPLMLFMLTDVIKSEESFGAFDLNLFDLYSQFVDAKHKLRLVQRVGMRKGDHLTEIRVKSMLTSNLPYYYHIAWNELLQGDAWDAENNELPPDFTDAIGTVAVEPADELIVTELLGYGLLVERGQTKQLVFKHRSFAEYFYARLLLLPQIPQCVRDTLFGFTYGPVTDDVLSNVEEFLETALSKGGLRLHLTTMWLLCTEAWNTRIRLLLNFVRGKLFPVLVREVLRTFMEDEPEDPYLAFVVLVAKGSEEAFNRLVEWMGEEREWSRRLLLKRKDQAAARLVVAIGIVFENQQLVTAEEVQKASDSLEDLISILASIEAVNRNKWGIVGERKFRKLVQNAGDTDLTNLTFDLEGVWKLFSIFSRKELISMFSSEKTRKTDQIGLNPALVIFALGEDFVPHRPHLADFRAKFGYAEGNTIFELGGLDFKFGMFWGDLLGETNTSSEGPVTAALREAIGCRAEWELLEKLEDEIRSRRSCPRVDNEAAVLEWVVDGGQLWDSLPSFPLGILPFLLRYSPSAEHVKHVLKDSEWNVGDKTSWVTLLKSLVISSHSPSFPLLLAFPLLRSFLRSHLHSCPPELAPLAKILLSTEREELQTLTSPFLLVLDVSIGQTILSLLPPQIPLDFPWVEVVGDVIQFTRCCELHVTLKKLRRVPARKLRGILLSDEILFEWKQRFTPRLGRKEAYACGLTGLLAFYFSVFGLNLEWMAEGGKPVERHLLASLPVEIAKTLEGNPQWTYLVPQYEESVATYFRTSKKNTLNELAGVCNYMTEEEWERLIGIVGDEATRQGTPTGDDTFSCMTAPLMRVLIRRYGVEETRQRVKSLWEQITNLTFVCDTLQSKASLLHCAIQLGELEEVERRAFPGLLPWRNPQGSNALDYAMENLKEDHPIRILLKKQSMILEGKSKKLNVKCVVN